MIGYRLERLTVLIVDDNKNMRSLLRTVLEALGVSQIIDARDGEHAIEKLQQYNIDLAIVDWVMEPMDGIALTQWVRTNPDSPDQFLPIIMLSGHTERERVVQARDTGITEFMAKPISARSLYKRIQAVIEHPRPFVRTKDYFGPDRRRQTLPFEGADRRKNSGGDAGSLTSDQEAALKRTAAGIKSLEKTR